MLKSTLESLLRELILCPFVPLSNVRRDVITFIPCYVIVFSRTGLSSGVASKRTTVLLRSIEAGQDV